MGKVEAQPVGRDQRAGLAGMLAQHGVQLGVQQVGGGVVAHDILAAGRVDPGDRHVAGARCAVHDLADMHDHARGWLAHIVHPHFPARLACRDNRAGIGDLPTRFDVEAGFWQQDLDLIARLGLDSCFTLAHERQDFAFDLQPLVGVVADAVFGELSGFLQVDQQTPVEGRHPRRPSRRRPRRPEARRCSSMAARKPASSTSSPARGRYRG